jgi:hypothetical protein
MAATQPAALGHRPTDHPPARRRRREAPVMFRNHNLDLIDIMIVLLLVAMIFGPHWTGR